MDFSRKLALKLRLEGKPALASPEGGPLEGGPELARTSLTGVVLSREGPLYSDRGQLLNHCSDARAVPVSLGELPPPSRLGELPLPSRQSAAAGEVGGEGAAALADACLDRAWDLTAARGEEAGELELAGPHLAARVLIAERGEGASQIEPPGPLVTARGLTAAKGEEAGEVQTLVAARGLIRPGVVARALPDLGVKV